MSMDGTGLTTRRTRRRVIGASGDLTIAAEHQRLVALSDAVRLENGRIPCTAVDICEGGMGVLCACFLPRRCRCEVRLLDPANPSTPAFSARVRVARPQMVDQRPGYQLGMIFDEDGPVFAERLRNFMELFDAA